MPVASLPLREMVQCSVEVPVGKVRPERVAEVQFRIGEIPEQEIRNPALAARADQQVGIRQAAERRGRRKIRLVDLRGIELTVGGVAGELALQGARQSMTVIDSFTAIVIDSDLH